MSYSTGGRTWCSPEDLFTYELREALEELWFLFTFDDGSDDVLHMIEMLRTELGYRETLSRFRSGGYWGKIGWPKRGTLVMVWDWRKKNEGLPYVTVDRFDRSKIA